MENSLAMGISDAARDLRHQPHALARLLAEHRRRAAKAPARRIFHAEKREALLTFADLVNRKNIWMIEARDRFGFAPKAHQRVMRVCCMREDTLDRDNATRVLLSRPINHSHAAAPDLFQNFVMTKAPLCVRHVRFREDTFERFARSLAFGFKSLAQETVDAGP